MSRRQKAESEQKYHNHICYYDGHKFHSERERKRYIELSLLQKHGMISNLETQVRIELIPKQRDPNGKYIPPVVYVADFTYTVDGRNVVEDVKPCGKDGKVSANYKKTPAWTVYQLKKKLLYHKTGIWIEEV